MPFMEVLDATGHLTLSWDPDDAASVDQARAEFDRLKGNGFAFFASDTPAAPKITALKGKALEHPGELSIRLVKEFQPRATRTVAVRPMAGG